MSDEDNIGEDDSEEAGKEGGAKKGGLGALLPNLLKFIAIGLGALIFIVTVAVITFNFMNNGGQSQTVLPESSAFRGQRPEYSYFTIIGQVNTRTRDQVPYTVVVDMVIGYDLNDNAAATELTSRLPELRDFVRNFFSSRYVNELQPDREGDLKQQILNELNTRLLNTARARIITFNKLDVMSM